MNFTEVGDWLTQRLTGATLAIQMPIVIAASVVLCGVLAVVLLRLVDLIGGPRLTTKKRGTK